MQWPRVQALPCACRVHTGSFSITQMSALIESAQSEAVGPCLCLW